MPWREWSTQMLDGRKRIFDTLSRYSTFGQFTVDVGSVSISAFPQRAEEAPT
jgi:hypothetical protein